MAIATMYIERCTMLTDVVDVSWSTRQTNADTWMFLRFIALDIIVAALGADRFHYHLLPST